MAAYAEGFNILAHANAGGARGRRMRKPRRSAIPSTINTICRCRKSRNSGGVAA